jgi:alkylhydroperoxidase family enzyme
VQFLAVYVREAHPSDGWTLPSNDKIGISISQPQTPSERTAVAQKCCAVLEITMPMVVDTLDDRVGHAYSGMPDRLYVIDKAGRVAYQGGRGPFGFKAGEMEQSLVMLLLDENGPSKAAHVPLLDNATAWKHLPEATTGAGEPLPAWARALARAQPRTTAATLELDYLHRASSPLEPRLRGLVRWAAANANRCPFTQAQALADLRRAGVDAAALKALTDDPKTLSAAERAAVEFARKMTSAAWSVTDDEVAALIKTHGEKQVVAMVQLLAYANFQDRLLHSLGVASADSAAAPALNVKFAKAKDAPPVPERKPPLDPPADAGPRFDDPEWLSVDFAELQKRMQSQRERLPRIRVPAWEDVLKNLPSGAAAPKRPLGIKWSLVCMGYQPRLAQGWSACTGAFRQDAKQDRIFEECLFWVVTRSLQCAY